ncbi:MAG TPA: GNAT family protein [Saprospiraceae bacterium]|nr:GNAT family protein [Saprospiraceae bacterium]
MLLKTDRLLLRPFADHDLPMVFKGLSHPQVIPYYGVRYDSLEATNAQMEWFAALEKNGTGQWWAICSSHNRIFYGAGGLNNLNREHRKAEIGFWLLPEYWGQGILAEAVPLILDYGFHKLELHRIEAFVETENQNCIRALAKLPFEHEGTMRDCEIKNGRKISLDIYARLHPGTTKT